MKAEKYWRSKFCYNSEGGKPSGLAGQGQESLPSSTTKEAEMRKQEFTPGWDEKRVKELIAQYENQTEDEEFADIEAAREAADIPLMAIPTELVPKVRALLAGK
jgi:hypothetical protein